jgi:hypothetical protein
MDDVDWVNMAQDSDRWLDLANTVINFRVPQNTGFLWTSLSTISFPISRRLCSKQLSLCK